MINLLLAFLLQLVVLSHEAVIFDLESYRYIYKPSDSPAKNEQYPGRGKAFFGRMADETVDGSTYWTNQVFPCGNATVDNAVPLVVNGVPTLEGQWPWHVAIYKSEMVNSFYICGGTLITHQSVISAAHCVTVRNARPVKTVDLSYLSIHLGKQNLITSRKGVQIRYVDSVVVHPDYNPRTFNYDLSVIKLDEWVQFTEWVNPACLWIDEEKDLNTVIGKDGRVVGFGNDGSGVLKQVKMPVVSEVTCIRSNPSFYGRFTSGFTFCAGKRDGSSSCNGDSGGGMFFDVGGFWYLRGVVSIAPAKDDEPVCDPSQYSVFTDVAQFLPWIRRNCWGQ